MGSNYYIGIADWKLALPPDRLLCSALGSCVAVCIYDARRSVCGLAHILLPRLGGSSLQQSPSKYADPGVAFLVKQLESNGSKRRDLTAKIAGGATLFNFKGNSSFANIGGRNVETVKSELNRLGIPIVAEDTGKDYGRTVEFDPASGLLHIRSMRAGILTI